MYLSSSLYKYGRLLDLLSFPTRRSSDLKFDELSNQLANHLLASGLAPQDIVAIYADRGASIVLAVLGILDRKSTRLNSSHTVISYAVFCLKKKIVGVQLEYRYTCLQLFP